MSEKNAERRSISWSFVEEALTAAAACGAEPHAVLAAAGLRGHAHAPVSAESYGALWAAIAAATNDEFFGLGGRALRPGSFTLLCHCVVSARTLAQALPRALRFLNCALDDPIGECVVADGMAQIVLKDKGAPRSAFAYRTYWIILHGIICWLAGRRMPLRLVDFRCAEPEEGADYRLFFGAPVRFGQMSSRIAFDAAFLKLPIRRTERALKQFLRGAPANLLMRYRYDAGLTAAIRTRLRETPPANWPKFDTLAQQMRMPVSTLRHRLKQEGQVFAQIKDEARRDLAIAALTQRSDGVGDVALRLGYGEPSAFHRAFRKWTGKSPGAFRRDYARARGAVPRREKENPA